MLRDIKDGSHGHSLLPKPLRERTGGGLQAQALGGCLLLSRGGWEAPPECQLTCRELTHPISLLRRQGLPYIHSADVGAEAGEVK